MNKMISVLFLALLLSACASSPLKKVWSAPDAQRLDFNKTFVVADGPSESIRRNAEEALVRDMYPLKGYAAYKIMDVEKLKDVESAKEFVKKNGFDGALVVKYLGTRQEVYDMPDLSPRMGFWGYYGHPYAFGFESRSVDTRNITSVEMTIFSLKEDKLIWSGYLEIRDPRDVDTSISKLSEAALNDLRKRGLL